MQFNNSLRDAEAEARAALLTRNGIVPLVEFGKDTRLILRRDPRPLVRHIDADGVGLLHRSDLDDAAVAELDGVSDKVHQNLRDALLISNDRGQVGRQEHAQFQVLLVGKQFRRIRRPYA